MSISSVGSAATSGTASTQLDAQKTLQQRAEEGDPVAQAELKQDQELEQGAKSGATEPGKGEQVDIYI